MTPRSTTSSASCEAAGYDGDVQPFDYLGVLPARAVDAGADRADADHLRGGRRLSASIDQSDPGDVTAAVDGRRPPARPRQHVRQRLRGRRLRHLPGGQHRADPARHLHVRGEGRQRRSRRRRGRDHLQPGQHGDRPARASRRHPRRHNASGIPVVGTTYALGEEWPARRPEMRMFADAIRDIAHDLQRARRDAGARRQRRDGRRPPRLGGAGPGINDNGSGSAAILEVAEQMQKVKPRNKVRFAWWGAEESGLVGSDFYVNGLTRRRARGDRALPELRHGRLAELRPLRLRRRRLDASGSPARRARRRSRRLFEDFYADRGLAFEPTQIDFRSDYAAVLRQRHPVRWPFTGAEGIKTAEQAALYGGTAGQPTTPATTRPATRSTTTATEVLDLNADAIAYAVAAVRDEHAR